MIIVGAPVHQRAWVLRDWFEHLAKQTIEPARLHLVLNYGASSDETLEIIEGAQAEHGFGRVSVLTDEGMDHLADRRWNEGRYATMVRLRNGLLDYVRGQSPGLYLSLDTDILLPSTAVENLVDALGTRYHAVGPLTHMTPTGRCPNAFGMTGERWRLGQIWTGVHQVFAVFGAVLMDHEMVEKVDYSAHPRGEDLGWAVSAWRQRLPMAIDLDVKAKHVMNPGMLTTIDERIGF